MKNCSNVILIFLTLLISHCSSDKSEDNVPLPVVKAPQELKDYVIFQPGTYWIYKDSASGVEDSTYVFEAYNNYDTLENGQGAMKPGIYEYFKISAYSEFDDYYYYYNYDGADLVFDPYISYAIRREKLTSGDYEGEEYCIIYPFTLGYQRYWWASPQPASVAAFYNTLVDDGNSFSNVVKMSHLKSVTESHQNTNFYFGKNIGIIRKELLDSNKVWKLVRYNIIQ